MNYNKLYMIVRYYQNDRPSRVMAKNLTLQQAQDWCEDPETSSMTKGNPGVKRLKTMNDKQLHWFDGYTEQR